MFRARGELAPSEVATIEGARPGAFVRPGTLMALSGVEAIGFDRVQERLPLARGGGEIALATVLGVAHRSVPPALPTSTQELVLVLRLDFRHPVGGCDRLITFSPVR